MQSWVFLTAVLAILAGIGLTIYSLLRVLKQLQAQRQLQTGSEALLLESKLRELAAAQNEIAGRFSQAIESQSKSQGDLQRAVTDRLESLDKRLGESLKETAAKTAETLGGLQARLTVIDEAQNNIASLSGQVVSLQEILSDKQSRGAFGQERMEGIVADQLPPPLYEFQATLSNGNRPDCIIRIPNVDGVLVIDSKFPLEAFEEMRTAGGDDQRKLAMARLRAAVLKHVKDITERYLIPGETYPPALMFVPSESVYAELHASFPEIIQKARRAQAIVSPHVFALAINTIQTLVKDARMREQASLIQNEVGALLQDVNRLAERIGNLKQHFDRTNKDIANRDLDAQDCRTGGVG
jgi:DNA recombination protein RmuC